MLKNHSRQNSTLQHLLSDVALWQSMTFLLYLCLIWANEKLPLAEIFFNLPETNQSNSYSASLLTVGLVIVAFITIAHTYVQQHRVLEGYIRVCSYCKKVHVENTEWEQLEHFVSTRTLAEFTHGICPSCYDREMGDAEPGTTPSPDLCSLPSASSAL